MSDNKNEFLYINLLINTEIIKKIKSSLKSIKPHNLVGSLYYLTSIRILFLILIHI